MNMFYSIAMMLLLIGSVWTLTVFQQTVLAKTPKETDPCKAYKDLIKIIQIAGLSVVGTGDDEKMSEVIDFFTGYANEIMKLPAPEMGKC
jgi:hypothetical protein